MNRKRNVGLCILLAILLVGGMAGSYFLLHNPPLGSEFTMWEPISAEDVFPTRTEVTLRLDGMEEQEPAASGETWTVISYEMENRGSSSFAYERFSYALQYRHYGSWYTVFLCIPHHGRGRPAYQLPGRRQHLGRSFCACPESAAKRQLPAVYRGRGLPSIYRIKDTVKGQKQIHSLWGR